MFDEHSVDSVGLFRFRSKEEQDTMFIASERLMLTDDNKVVREGDPRARKLLVAKGSELSKQDAEKYGLIPKDGSYQIRVPDSDVALSLEEVSREPTASEKIASAVPSNIGGTNAASKVATGPMTDSPPQQVNAPPAPPPSTSPQTPAPATATTAPAPAPKAAAKPATEAPKGTVPATPPPVAQTPTK